MRVRNYVQLIRIQLYPSKNQLSNAPIPANYKQKASTPIPSYLDQLSIYLQFPKGDPYK